MIMTGFVVYRRPEGNEPPGDGLDPLLLLFLLGLAALIGGWVWLGYWIGWL